MIQIMKLVLWRLEYYNVEADIVILVAIIIIVCYMVVIIAEGLIHSCHVFLIVPKCLCLRSFELTYSSPYSFFIYSCSILL